MFVVFFFKQKTAYEITTGDWSSDVCSSDLAQPGTQLVAPEPGDAGLDAIKHTLGEQAAQGGAEHELSHVHGCIYQSCLIPGAILGGTPAANCEPDHAARAGVRALPHAMVRACAWGGAGAGKRTGFPTKQPTVAIMSGHGSAHRSIHRVGGGGAAAGLQRLATATRPSVRRTDRPRRPTADGCRWRTSHDVGSLATQASGALRHHSPNSKSRGLSL